MRPFIRPECLRAAGVRRLNAGNQTAINVVLGKPAEKTAATI
jgi:hypothetical protein